LGLAEHFDRVIASDAAAKQIENATAHAKVQYRVGPAEKSELPDASVDLVTVAQALHWFDLDAFYREVRRVLKPGGALAVWCYGLSEIAPAVDRWVLDFYANRVGAYWPPERRYIDERYETIAFPFKKIASPGFYIEANFTLEEFLGYLRSWSATQCCIAATNEDPLPDLKQKLAPAWGAAEAPRTIRWPIYLRVGTMP
jgi:SAM-dependent methyltransferase